MNNDIVAGFDSDSDKNLELRLQKIEEVDRSLLIYASGRIDFYNSHSFLKRARRAVEAGFIRLIINMKGVNFASSTGVGALVQLMQEAAARGGEVVLLRMQPTVHEVLQLLGLARNFTVMEDLGESIAHLAGHLPAPAFPTVFRCPICGRRLRASRPGRFRCGGCRTILRLRESTRAMIA